MTLLTSQAVNVTASAPAGGDAVPGADVAQRFVFADVDWAFYEEVRDRRADRRVFVTYFKGRLEVVTVSFLHELVTGLLALMIRVLAEEADRPLKGAGMTTLRRKDLDLGVEADSSFYSENEPRMRNKTALDLSVDPPPDLAIEVEITNRLGVRKSIYRELGVPELWVYSSGGLAVMLRRDGGYVGVDRSPTFPQLSPQELFGYVAAGLVEDETQWVKRFRQRVREAIASARIGDATG